MTLEDSTIIEDSIAEASRDFTDWPLNRLGFLEHNSRGYQISLKNAEIPTCSGPTLIGGHSSCGIFGHFVLDTLPMLLKFKSHLNAGRVKVAFFATNFPPESKWAFELIDTIGIDRSAIIELDHHTVTRFDHAIITHHHSGITTQYPCKDVETLFGYLRQQHQAAVGHDRIFFLRRQNARLANQLEVAAELLNHGFSIVDPRSPTNT